MLTSANIQDTLSPLHTFASDIFTQLNQFYETKVFVDSLEDYIVTHHQLDKLVSQTMTQEVKRLSGSTLFSISEDQNDFFLAMTFSDQIFATMADQNQIDLGNRSKINALQIVIEEVSHAFMIFHRIIEGKTIPTQQELELQAEIDKFHLLARLFANTEVHPYIMLKILYKKIEYVASDKTAIYEFANQSALNSCTSKRVC